MEIRVSGHQVDTGAALRTHVNDRMQAIADKYFSRSISAHATFGTGPHASFTCDIVAHVMQGVILKGHGQGNEAHPAFDQAAARVETQLRRYMRRLKDKQATTSMGGAAVYDAGYDENAGYTVFQPAPEEEEANDNPVIIAETRVDVPDATVSDAVMMLDLRNTGALLFRNLGTGAFNMVYRRPDGTIGWVEPQRAA
jgi:ribosomal subunit interface protein